MTTTRIRSVKEAQSLYLQELKDAGATWAEIGEAFRERFGVNARVAMRLSRGWSQRQAADEWNVLWPDDPKTFKNFSYWEQWPSATGYTPSLEVLEKLARLYGCRVVDLLSDASDFSHLDPAKQHRSDLHGIPGAIAATRKESSRDASDDRQKLAEFVARLQDGDVGEMASTVAGWAKQVDNAVDRRSLLIKLSFVLTTAAALPDNLPTIPALTDTGIRSSADMNGIWRSEYTYFSSRRNAEYTDMHYVVIRQNQKAVAVESLKHPTGSELSLSLALDGMFATGTWQERTSPTGYYRGAIYRGAIQLLVEPSLTSMTGKWVGFGKNFSINNGDWTFSLETRDTSAPSLRSYADRLQSS